MGIKATFVSEWLLRFADSFSEGILFLFKDQRNTNLNFHEISVISDVSLMFAAIA